MICPYCQTDNRDDQETCYYCHKDISMLRLIVNKAKHHYNVALEHAERDRTAEAIAELKNALDLDASIVNARVVLGTLYARQEMFDEARQAWEEALDSDYRFRKAHEYLIKAGQAEYVFPGMKRLQRLNIWLLRLMVLLAVLVVLLGVLLALPDSERPRMIRALAIARNKPLVSGQTVHQLNALAADEKTPAEISDYARNLTQQIELAWEEDLSIARAALENGSALVALEALRNLTRKSPDEKVLAEVEVLYREAGEQLSGDLQVARDSLRSDAVSYDSLAPRIEQIARLMPEGFASDRITSLTAEIERIHLESMLDQVRNTAAESSLPEAIALANQWRKEHPALAGPLSALIRQRLVTETAMAEVQVRGLIQTGQYGEASQALDRLAALYDQAAVEPPSELLTALHEEIRRARMAAALKAADDAFAVEDWETYLGLTRRPTDLADDEATLTRLGQQRARAIEEIARERWQWFDSRKDEFATLSISEEDAAQAVKLYEPLLDTLPPDLTWARGPLAFYAAAARLKLGNPGEARVLLARIQSDYGDSYIAETAAQFERTFAEELGLPAETVIPTERDNPTTAGTDATGPTEDRE